MLPMRAPNSTSLGFDFEFVDDEEDEKQNSKELLNALELLRCALVLPIGSHCPLLVVTCCGLIEMFFLFH